ncbi:MAG: serine/threonine protein kinase [Alphaproteobacteria bacterium]|nr:serine/threonine protein kinase [Alphaproteobacteria bacterium]MCB9698301.1 serine/threonine protein kinase [Alphaproteobacteria bacterium]
MIGTTLDKYSVLQKVGEGGMATVYRGRHATLDRDVAIKVLHPHLSSSSRMRKRFEREAQAIEHLRHENILEIFDYSGLEASDCYIVTEFVEGETLSSLLSRRGRLPSEIVALLGIAVCSALSYAHDRGILHRDIKTDNIMVRVDGTVKLMDFGIARFLDETRVTMTGALVGSPAFMSPEQAREAKLDQRSDLFSLGTVLFDLVTGTLPFTGSNPSLILKNVIEGNRPAVSELAPSMSATLADVIERLMATAVEDRYNQASEVADHLRGVLREARIEVHDPQWALVRWLHDPDEYEQRLGAQLSTVLVADGRSLLESGDHLAALRLLNRVLSMDEDNAEVLALVQNLHVEPRGAQQAEGHRRWLGVGAGTFLLVGVAGLALFAMRRGGDPEPVRGPPTVVPAAVPTPQPPLPSPVVPPPAPVEPAPTEPRVVAPAPPEVRPPVRPRPGLVSQVVRPRPVPVPEPVGTAEEVAPVGTVRLNTHQYVADVYWEGKRLGSSRDDLVVPVGTQELTLKHQLLEDQSVQVTVSSGELRVVEVSLRPRPSRVAFGSGWDGACTVVANGVSVGTLEALHHTLSVETPDRPLTVALGCPDGRSHEQGWAAVPPPLVRFPDPP